MATKKTTTAAATASPAPAAVEKKEFNPGDLILCTSVTVGELLGVGELLKDGLALLLGSREECVELPLRQHGHAAKLLERQSDGVQERLASLGLHFRPRPSIDGVVPLGRSVLDVTAARGLVGVAQLQAQR